MAAPAHVGGDTEPQSRVGAAVSNMISQPALEETSNRTVTSIGEGAGKWELAFTSWPSFLQYLVNIQLNCKGAFTTGQQFHLVIDWRVSPP